MTRLSNGTVVTDRNDDTQSTILFERGYTVRHIETFHTQGESFIHWDAPPLTEADLPY